MKKENGITLVALVITIIVLLILAGVTVATLTGDNGLLTKSKTAVDKYSEGEIKERIMLAVANARMKNMSLLDRTVLDNELKSEFGEGKFELLPVGEGYLISVNNIEYLVEKDGKVSDGNKVEESNIEYAGDLSKGGQYDGTTEETAYRITCIEDLVEWSNNYNNYSSKNIKLENTIDFNSTASYNNARTKTTDINENGDIEELITELTTGTGFKPISTFSGTFDGQNNEIKKIYINNKSNYNGLIGTAGDKVIIKNLSISGYIKTSGSYIGGIVGIIYRAETSSLIKNCHNYCDVTAGGYAGGIVGYVNSNKCEVINCSNNGKISINSGDYCGGIVGNFQTQEGIICGCYNTGIAKNGISGTNAVIIANCYNTGETINGLIYANNGKTYNSYSIGKSGKLVHYSNYSNSYISKCFYLKGSCNRLYQNGDSSKIDLVSGEKEENDMKSSNFLTTLNSCDITNYSNFWKEDINNINNGYPILNWQ